MTMKEYIRKNIFADPEIVETRIFELEKFLELFPDSLLADSFRNELTYLNALYEHIA